MRVEHREVHLIVQAEGAVVEVGRADDAPEPVDDEHLGVDHRRLVLVDLGARGEQPPVAAAARKPRDRMVVPFARREDGDRHAAARGALKLGEEAAIWQEIRRADVDRFARRGDEHLEE